MTYGVILASGVGSRMKMDMPKQFIRIDNIPIFVYAVCSMLKVSEIGKILIVCHPDYMQTAKEMIDSFIDESFHQKLMIIEGGRERIDSIDCAVKTIVSAKEVATDDVVIFHDAVRPFVTKEILLESISGARAKGATVAAIPAVDTMLYSEDGAVVIDIPERANLYCGQAPDSFRLEYFLELRNNLTEEEKSHVFGTSKLCELNGKPIYIIKGDEKNFKITTPQDLVRAAALVDDLKGNNDELFSYLKSQWR